MEGRNFEIRKHLLGYDNIMNQQRDFTYKKRNQILEQSDLKEDIKEALHDTIEIKMDQIFGRKAAADNWDLDTFNNYLFSSYGVRINKEEIQLDNTNFDSFLEFAYEKLLKVYDAREQKFTPQLTRQIERHIMLEIIDNKWKEHLFGMDQLKEGISWRSYAERDPLVEYKFEGFRLFREMVNQIKAESLDILYKVEPVGIEENLQQQTALEAAVAFGQTQHSEFGQFDVLKQAPDSRGEGPRTKRAATASNSNKKR